MSVEGAIEALTECGIVPDKARKIVAACGSYGLHGLTVSELVAHRVPEVQAQAVVGALAFAKRVTTHATHARESVYGAEMVFDLLRPLIGFAPAERFYVVGVDCKPNLIGYEEIGMGTPSSVEAHPREVFRPLLRMAAQSGIIAHNHPSGDPTPSREDVEITRRLVAVGELVGIPIIDHIVITSTDFRSIMRTHGATIVVVL